MEKIILLFVSLCVTTPLLAFENIKKLYKPYTIKNIETFTIDSRILQHKYDIYIKLPFDYYKPKAKQKSYPVLYVNDAPYTFKAAAGVTHLAKMNKAIIVGIDFAHGESPKASRIRDLTPVFAKSWKKYTTGGAPEYLQFIEQEVIAFVEKNYRVDASHRVLSGQSLGGLFGAWVLLTKPQVFSDYILTSPSLWFNNRMIFDAEVTSATKHNNITANVYMATGDLERVKNGKMYDMADDQEKWVNQLKSRKYKNLNIESEVVTGTDHESTFPAGLSKGLRWLYDDVWKLQ